MIGSIYDEKLEPNTTLVPRDDMYQTKYPYNEYMLMKKSGILIPSRINRMLDRMEIALNRLYDICSLSIDDSVQTEAKMYFDELFRIRETMIETIEQDYESLINDVIGYYGN